MVVSRGCCGGCDLVFGLLVFLVGGVWLFLVLCVVDFVL